eukprot:g1115.t1
MNELLAFLHTKAAAFSKESVHLKIAFNDFFVLHVRNPSLYECLASWLLRLRSNALQLFQRKELNHITMVNEKELLSYAQSALRLSLEGRKKSSSANEKKNIICVLDQLIHNCEKEEEKLRWFQEALSIEKCFIPSDFAELLAVDCYNCGVILSKGQNEREGNAMKAMKMAQRFLNEYNCSKKFCDKYKSKIENGLCFV